MRVNYRRLAKMHGVSDIVRDALEGPFLSDVIKLLDISPAALRGHQFREAIRTLKALRDTGLNEHLETAVNFTLEQLSQEEVDHDHLRKLDELVTLSGPYYGLRNEITADNTQNIPDLRLIYTHAALGSDPGKVVAREYGLTSKEYSNARIWPEGLYVHATGLFERIVGELTRSYGRLARSPAELARQVSGISYQPRSVPSSDETRIELEPASPPDIQTMRARVKAIRESLMCVAANRQIPILYVTDLMDLQTATEINRLAKKRGYERNLVVVDAPKERKISWMRGAFDEHAYRFESPEAMENEISTQNMRFRRSLKGQIARAEETRIFWWDSSPDQAKEAMRLARDIVEVVDEEAAQQFLQAHNKTTPEELLPPSPA